MSEHYMEWNWILVLSHCFNLSSVRSQLTSRWAKFSLAHQQWLSYIGDNDLEPFSPPPWQVGSQMLAVTSVYFSNCWNKPELDCKQKIVFSSTPVDSQVDNFMLFCRKSWVSPSAAQLRLKPDSYGISLVVKSYVFIQVRKDSQTKKKESKGKKHGIRDCLHKQSVTLLS